MPLLKRRLIKRNALYSKNNLEKYILNRFDEAHLIDFRKLYAKDPNEALKRLKQWEEF